jgi:hypothetical protein
MADEIIKVELVNQDNGAVVDNIWELEDNVRIIRRYFELKANPDKFDKAMATIKKENDTLSEELKKEDAYKEKIGFSKK